MDTDLTIGPDGVAELRRHLQAARERVVGALDGLSEYDVRRPLTASGTCLLGIVKHLVGVETGYLADSVGRPLEPPLPWVADGSVWDGADMWATPQESRAELLAAYRAAWARSDAAVDELGPAHPAHVAWWAPEKRATTLGVVLVRVSHDTAQHAGHADVLRELLDGRGGPDRDAIGDDAYWTEYVARVQAAAEPFREPAAGAGRG